MCHSFKPFSHTPLFRKELSECFNSLVTSLLHHLLLFLFHIYQQLLGNCGSQYTDKCCVSFFLLTVSLSFLASNPVTFLPLLFPLFFRVCYFFPPLSTFIMLQHRLHVWLSLVFHSSGCVKRCFKNLISLFTTVCCCCLINYGDNWFSRVHIYNVVQQGRNCIFLSHLSLRNTLYKTPK